MNDDRDIYLTSPEIQSPFFVFEYHLKLLEISNSSLALLACFVLHKMKEKPIKLMLHAHH